MPFGLMGVVLVFVIAVGVQLASVAVAGRCVAASPPGWSLGEVVRISGCPPPTLRSARLP